jgi:hypothetical protein
MKNRFTHNSRFGRHSISDKDRAEVYKRDDFICQYCMNKFGIEKLSIDHLVPVALGGLHEIRNYITCCRSCNSSKRHTPLSQFAKKNGISIEDLPIHGDPVIDNKELPIEIRLLRKRIFDGIRKGEIEFKGKNAQQKIEKKYRTDVWNSSLGKVLTTRFPTLPGHVLIMIPEIDAIAKSKEDIVLLQELAKSAKTRDQIEILSISELSVKDSVMSLLKKTKDISLQNRLQQALYRTQIALRKNP